MTLGMIQSEALDLKVLALRFDCVRQAFCDYAEPCSISYKKLEYQHVK
jgi:hypothetical protein